VQIAAARPERGCQPAHDAREQRDAEVEQRGRCADTDGRDPRQAGRRKRADHGDAPERERQPDDPAYRREERAFRQQLPHQAPSSGAERSAHRKFAAARRRSRQQQVADVRADHHKKKSDDAEQYQKCRADVADDLMVQREDGHADAGVRGRVRLGDSRGHAVEISLRLRERGSRLQPRDDGQRVAVVRGQLLWRERERHEQLVIRIRVSSCRSDRHRSQSIRSASAG
jgi:hypothetical protein